MKRLRLTIVGLFLAAATSVAAAQSSIGIAPVYDGGGDAWGSIFTQYMTLYTFQKLQDDKMFSPTLLNPGGVYTPLDTSWLVDYTQDRDGIDLLLVTTLKPVVRPSHGKWDLSADVVLIDKKSGDQRDAWTVTTEIKGRDTDVEVGLKETDPLRTLWGMGTGHRIFKLSPLGKAAERLADQIHEDMQTRLHSSGLPEKPAGSGVNCPMKVRITYNYKHAASQAYSLFVNGLEEAIVVQDGVASFTAPDGPLLVQFSVADAPYKLAAQPIYQISTLHACSSQSSTYIVDLARGGDAHDHWE